jgi:cholesterol oxidase
MSPLAPPEARLSFTEEMRGEVTGPEAKGPISFRLTIVVEDMASFLADPEHEAAAFGAVRCEALGGDRPVVDGRFKLMTCAPGGQKRMRYMLPFAGHDGEPLLLAGVKYLVPGHDLWTDTTTLYTRILGAGEGALRQVVASGVMRLGSADLMKQLGTFRSGRTAALLDFGQFFTGALWEVYGAPRLGLRPAPTPCTDHPLEEDS